MNYSGCIHVWNPPETTHLQAARWLFQTVGIKQWQQRGAVFKDVGFFRIISFLKAWTKTYYLTSLQQQHLTTCHNTLSHKYYGESKTCFLLIDLS